MMAMQGQRDCEEVMAVRRREVVVEKKEAWWKREEERKSKLRMKEWEVAELERTGRLEDDPIYGMKAPWRSRGRGRHIPPREQSPGHSPERYVNEEFINGIEKRRERNEEFVGSIMPNEIIGIDKRKEKGIRNVLLFFTAL